MTNTKQLLETARDGNLDTLQTLMKQYQLNEYFGDETLLYIACRNGRLNIVQYLLSQKGIDIQKGRKNPEQTPLYTACYWKHDEVVKLMLKYGARLKDDFENFKCRNYLKPFNVSFGSTLQRRDSFKLENVQSDSNGQITLSHLEEIKKWTSEEMKLINQQLDSVENEMKSFRCENEEWKEIHSEGSKSTERIDALERSLKQLNDLVNNLYEGQKNQGKKQLNEGKKQDESVKQISNIEKQISQLSDQLVNIKKENQQLQSLINQVKNSKDQPAKEAPKNDDENGQLKKRITELEKFTKQNSTTPANPKEIEDLKKKVSELTQKLEKSTEVNLKVATLSKTLSELESTSKLQQESIKKLSILSTNPPSKNENLNLKPPLFTSNLLQTLVLIPLCILIYHFFISKSLID